MSALPSCRMCRHACSRKGVISSDSAVMPAQRAAAAAVMACGDRSHAARQGPGPAQGQQGRALLQHSLTQLHDS